MEMLSTSRQQNAVVIKITLDYEWTIRTQICMLQNQTDLKPGWRFLLDLNNRTDDVHHLNDPNHSTDSLMSLDTAQSLQ